MEQTQPNPSEIARESLVGGKAPDETGQKSPVVNLGHVVSNDTPSELSIAREEIALLRAFLANEIDAILFENNAEKEGL